MKKKLSMLFVAILFAGFSCFGANYYVSTGGNDSNNGSSSSPFKTLQKAISVVSAGDYIYIGSGTHQMTTASVVITKNGTSSANIHVFASSGTPVLSFDDNENSSNRGIVMDGDYWHWQGITIEKAGDNGMLLSGNNNTIENCVFRKNHDTGLQLSRYNTDADQISEWPSNNLIVGCEAFDNADSDSEDADGFAAKLTCGTGNVFRSCVSHHNIDDGWDLYTKEDTGPIGVVLFEDCIAHHNGILTDGATSGGGDKNGFKLGSSSNTVNHELRRCIAYSNGKHGFTDNGNIGNIKFYNLTSYDNGDYNYHTRDGASHTFRNCITLDGNHTDRIVGDAPTSCNGFDDTDTDWSITVSSSDFQTLSQGSNSDPTSNGFLNLSSSSSLIDAGCSASGVSGNGTLDLGAIEYGGTTPPPTTYTLSTSVSGSGTVSGAGTYNSGTTATVSASAASGWIFSNWSGAASGTSTSASVYMDGNKSVTAVFIEDDGTTPPPTPGDYIHNFTESGLSSSFYSISGNLSTSKGTVTYEGLTLTQCLKIESSTSISFTSTEAGALTLVFNSDFNGGFNVDGTSKNVSSGILTVDLSSGSHTLTKDETANLYYMSLAYEGGITPTTFALTTTINGSGSVNPSSGTYEAGTSVSMTATPASGWQFDSWSGGSTSNPATVIMDADKNITANFSQLTTEDGTISLTANAGNAQVDLAWTSSNIASSYEVYRDLDSDPTGRVRIATVAATSYSDATVSNGTTYYYWIKATDVNGTAINSNVAQATPQGGVDTEITIQENAVGFCNVDGSVDNNNAGFTGDGFANTTNSTGTGIDYKINASGGSVTLLIQYASSSDRPANIIVNGSTVVSSLSMPSTGSWTTWSSISTTITLASGVNDLRIEASGSDGLGNVDYISVTGAGVSAADCNGVVPTTYTLSTSVSGSGSVSGAGTYNEGTVVTLTATPSSGYVLSSWNGVDASNGNTATVTMNANKSVSVTFTQISVTTYALTTTIVGQGSINPSSGTYEAGTSVSMTATPANGWQFDSWSGGSTSNPATVVMDADKNITANFSEIATDQTITLQENQTGFCNVDGSIDNNNAGFTGDGFANTTNSAGTGVDWKVNFASTGTYTFVFRYASSSDRPANLMINGSTVVSGLSMPSSGAWTTWTTVSVSANVSAGENDVRLEATGSTGLANIDYLEVTGSGVSAANCNEIDPETFTLSVNANPSAGGSVSGAGTYDAGTVVTLTASANTDYVFSDWTGASGSATTTVTVNSNLSVTANFTYVGGGDEGADFAMVGFATENGGTTGGSGGTTVYASTGDQILAYIDAKKDGDYSSGLVIMVNGTITPSNTDAEKIDIKECRDVSIIGVGTSGEFNGIGIKVYKAGNVILRNLEVHHVAIGDKDCISIEGSADHVWVDHCELYNEYGDDVDKDYYDGLLDAKSDAQYLTYSWNYLHDSWKTMLVGSGDSDDTDRMLTIHHNIFENCNSRMPLFRFGTGHIFNNYYVDGASTAINSRMGACLKIENNYFENVQNPYVSAYSDEDGYGDLSGNILDNCTWLYIDDVRELGSCNSNIPYSYSSVLNGAANVPSITRSYAGVGKVSNPANYSVKSAEGALALENVESLNALAVYPNPFSNSTVISFNLEVGQEVSMNIYDMTGRLVDIVPTEVYSAGQHELVYNNGSLNTGMYLLQVQTGSSIQSIRLLVK